MKIGPRERARISWKTLWLGRAALSGLSWVQFSCSVVSNFLWPHGPLHVGFPVHHHVPEPTQTHVHCVGEAIQPSHPLLPPSPPAFNLSQHQGLLKWVSFSHQVAKVLEFPLQHQSFQWIFRTDHTLIIHYSEPFFSLITHLIDYHFIELHLIYNVVLVPAI